ncbi:MAG: hypothetical protein PHS62_00570 [Patescibacteria group bacterium]|nr:hypothetical protein [Patescibacteria group bacterium]
MREIMPNMPAAPEQRQNENRLEQEPGFDLEVYVTDHSPDNLDTGDPEKLRELYQDVASDGVARVRYDFHWGKLEGQPGKFDQQLFGRYKSAKTIQEEVGLKAPIIILSNPPAWAIKLYKEGKKDEFFQAFKSYAETVKQALDQAGGKKITTIQILNELNNTQYTPVAVDDIPEICRITREVFHEYNPDLKLMVTINANSMAKMVGSDAGEYLHKLKNFKGSFDRIAIDNYPGTWHFPQKIAELIKSLNFSSWPPTKEVFKTLVKQFDYLEKMLREVANWGIEYEVGEVGIPSKLPWGGEKSQRYFYDILFRFLKHLLMEFRQEGIKLPSSLGLYEAIDEPPKTFMGKVADMTPWPEYEFGMRRSDGGRKEILRGRKHFPQSEEVRLTNLARVNRSQLRANIDYLRQPMKIAKNQAK